MKGQGFKHGDETGSDDEVVNAIRSGGEKAFESLYRLYYPVIYHFVLGYVHAVPLAEDITQEVFMKIWRNRERLADVRSLKSYLYTTARNHTINSLKAAFRSKAGTIEILTPFLIQRNNTEDELVQKEYRQFLRNILDTLPTRTREVFILCREEGKSYEEAASTLGVSKNAIKNHMVFSMKVFKLALKKHLGISLSLFLSLLLRS